MSAPETIAAPAVPVEDLKPTESTTAEATAPATEPAKAEQPAVVRLSFFTSQFVSSLSGATQGRC